MLLSINCKTLRVVFYFIYFLYHLTIPNKCVKIARCRLDEMGLFELRCSIEFSGNVLDGEMNQTAS